MGLQAPEGKPQSGTSRGLPLKWIDRLLMGVFALCVLFMLWQVDTHVSERRVIFMTDPGALELKAAWRIGVDGEGKPVIHTISVIRNSPTETVSAWESRFVETIQADLITYPPIN